MAGAGYGGEGGDDGGYQGGSTYGSTTKPSHLGSGGGGNNGSAGSGGGVVKLIISDTTTIFGSITSNGGNVNGGGGSGGSIWINTNVLIGTGTITVNGGTNASFGGGGAGGRIAVYYTTDNSSLNYTAYGGLGDIGIAKMGGAGTIYKKSSSQSAGDLTIDNNNQDEEDGIYIGKTVITDTLPLNTLTIQNYGHLYASSTSNITYNTINWSDEAIIEDYGGLTTIFANTPDITIASTSRLYMNTTETINNLTINGKLSHSRNTTAETNKINLIVKGNVDISSTGSINLNGKGYSGGYGTGAGSDQGSYGSGAGHGGVGGVTADGGSTGGIIYGSTTTPVNIGSGGGDDGGVTGGPSGGGAIQIFVSGDMAINGSISTNGDNAVNTNGGGASGGSIYILADDITGNGTISANGGNPKTANAGGGAGGRIAIYYNTLDSNIIATSTGGGTTYPGEEGTVYTQEIPTAYWTGASSTDWFNENNWSTASVPTSTDNAVINGNYSNAPTLNLSSGSVTVYSLTIGTSSASTLTISNGSDTKKLIVSGGMIVGANGILTHTANTTAQTHVINLEANNFTIESGGTINVSGKGYDSSEGLGQGAGSSNRSGGAGYGGEGGDGILNGVVTAASGITYGSTTKPNDLGSGGGYSNGGEGGGAVKLVITGTTTIFGTVIADGSVGRGWQGGGGSGGSIYINTATLEGAGTITVNGGNGSNDNTAVGNGGGGGGRIAVYYTTDSSSIVYNAYGGVGSGATSLQNIGGAGTIYKKSSVQNYGDLIIDNNDQNYAEDSYLGKTVFNDTTIAFDTITISNYGHIDIPVSADIIYSTLNWDDKGVITDNGGTFDEVSGGGALIIATTSRVFEKTSRSFTNLTVNGAMNTEPLTVSGDVYISGITTLTNHNISTDKMDVTGDVTISSGGYLTHYINTTAQTHVVHIEASNFILSSGCSINVNGRGYDSSEGLGQGAGSSNRSGGAGYGGEGGDGILNG
ncbi:hypothetical protein DRH27_05590, partial [Candidatus Falkowbacteria bacterium]